VAKLSISIPDDLKELLTERADAEHVPVSQIVSDALRSYFEKPPDPVTPPKPTTPSDTATSSAEIRQMQEYLWDLHHSYERTRSTVLVLYHRADESSGDTELLGIPPESSFKKPPWPKPRPQLP